MTRVLKPEYARTRLCGTILGLQGEKHIHRIHPPSPRHPSPSLAAVARAWALASPASDTGCVTTAKNRLALRLWGFQRLRPVIFGLARLKVRINAQILLRGSSDICSWYLNCSAPATRWISPGYKQCLLQQWKIVKKSFWLWLGHFQGNNCEWKPIFCLVWRQWNVLLATMKIEDCWQQWKKWQLWALQPFNNPFREFLQIMMSNVGNNQ